MQQRRYDSSMAELILAVNANTINAIQYEDGDIIAAFNNKRIKYVHAYHNCINKIIPFNQDGLRITGSLADTLLQETRQYKFERINRTTVRRTLLRDLTTEDFDNTPNAEGKHMDVPLFINRKLQNPNHYIFGTTNSEFWYGGTTGVTDAGLNTVWTQIESETSLLEINHRLWPSTTREKRKFFGMTVDDFDDTEAGVLTSSERGVDDVLVKKRSRKVDYVNLPDMTQEREDDIRDDTQETDERTSKSYTRSSVVEVKT